MCTLSDFTQVGVGMTDGHVMVLGIASDSLDGDKGAQILN